MNPKLDEDGRIFLSDRGLCLTTAEKMGVYSANGEISFPYVFNGEVVRIKHRNMADKKKMHFNKVDENLKSDFKMPFWNQIEWPTVDHLIITEGELDCIALTQLGPNKVVSLPSGAGGAVATIKAQFEYLQRFDLIYIAFDMDAAGNKAAEQVKEFIPSKKYRRIVFPSKDANDWIKENAYVDQECFQILMNKAQKVTVDQVTNLNDIDETYVPPMYPGVSTGFEDLDEILGGIRSREMTIVSADTGAGKTTLCINLLCNLVANDPSGFWLNSWEMDYRVLMRKIASNVLKKKFKTQGFSLDDLAAFKAWMRKSNCYINPTRSYSDIPALRKQVELAAKIHGVKYILLDHLDYISDTSKHRESHLQVKEAVVAVHDMAMEFDVHIFLIAHAKQSDDKAGGMHMGQIRGGASIKQYADNLLILQNMAQDNLAVKDNRLKVDVAKNRFFGKRGQIYLRYDQETDSYGDNTFTPRTISSDN